MNADSSVQSGRAPTRASVLHGAAVPATYLAWYLLFFSPVVFSRSLLEPGDSLHYYLPNFLIGVSLWEPLLHAGFPMAADPQGMSWYPLSLILSPLLWWDGFVLSAYVLASSFTYGYVHTLTRSRLAAFAAGLVYGMSGFMIVHQGHTTMIHAAAWLPLIVWSLERLRERTSPAWAVVGSLAVGCSVLAGHPQVTVYSLFLCAAYVLVRGWNLRTRRSRYYAVSAALVSLGLGLAAVQLLPSVELASRGVRAKMTFEEFITFSLHPYQSIEMLFPYLFGGSQWSFYEIPYFGQWNVAEITGYVGLLPLLLASVGLLSGRHEGLARFWFFAALAAFILTLGAFTPVSRLMYYVPALNKFRAPARHFLEFSLAVAALSGLGLAALQRALATPKCILGTTVVGAAVMLAGAALIFVFSDMLQGAAAAKGIPNVDVLPWENPAVGVPLVVFVIAAASLLLVARNPKSRAAQVLLICVLAVDMGSFGWFQYWRERLADFPAIKPPVTAQRYQALLEKVHQRAAPVRGAFNPPEAFPPNLNRLWGVPTISGYGPMIMSRVSRLFSMAPQGEMTGTWSSLNDRSLDAAAVRYVFVPSREAQLIPITDPRGLSWSPEDMNMSLGNGCGTTTHSASFTLPAEITATAIGVVSSLACSTHIQDGSPVVRISLRDDQGNVKTAEVLAGRDTSEWAYDCSDVRPHMKHGRATVFSSFPAGQSGAQCDGHLYAATLQNSRPHRLRQIELQWIGSNALIGIRKITLFDGTTGTSLALSSRVGDLADQSRWRHVEDIGGISVYENLRAMPRAWLVAEVMTAGPEEVLAAVQTSRLPDGRAFDPAMTALVEEPLTLRETADSTAGARIVELSARRIEVLTESAAPSFLVLSDVNYPGWRATVDNAPAKVYQTNYLFRGVPVPAGSHRVVFEFKPLTLYAGAGISLLSFGIISAVFVRSLLTRRSGTESPPEAQAARRS